MPLTNTHKSEKEIHCKVTFGFKYIIYVPCRMYSFIATEVELVQKVTRYLVQSFNLVHILGLNSLANGYLMCRLATHNVVFN